jgi:hypothetical protein
MEFHARVGYLACFAAPLQAAAVAALRLEGLSFRVLVLLSGGVECEYYRWRCAKALPDPDFRYFSN